MYHIRASHHIENREWAISKRRCLRGQNGGSIVVVGEVLILYILYILLGNYPLFNSIPARAAVLPGRALKKEVMKKPGLFSRALKTH